MSSNIPIETMDYSTMLPCEVWDKVFSYLPGRDLWSVGALKSLWRDQTNYNSLWIDRSRSGGWYKYGDENDPAYILQDRSDSSSSSMFSHPSAFNRFTPLDTPLPMMCKWKEVFMNVSHLNGNWNNDWRVFRTHNQVSAFDCDGRILLVGTKNGCLIIWNLLTHTILYRGEFRLLIEKIKICTDLAAIGCFDGTVRVFKIEPDGLVETWFLSSHNVSVEHLEFQGRLIVVATANKLKVWSLSQGCLLHILRGHQKKVSCLFMRGDRLVTGSYDTTLIIWNAGNGALEQRLCGDSGIVSDCQCDEEKVYSSSLNNAVNVWKIATGECLIKLNLKLGGTSFYCVTFNDRFIAAGTRDGQVCVWNLNGENLRRLGKHRDMVTHLQMKDGLLVSVGNTCEVNVCDLERGDCDEEHMDSDDGSVNNDLYLKSHTSAWMDETKLITLSEDYPFKLTVFDYWGDETI